MTKFNELPWRRVTGRAKRIVPKAPPLPYSRLAPSLARLPTTAPPSSIDDNNQSVCPVCLTNPRDLVCGCGHMIFDDTSPNGTCHKGCSGAVGYIFFNHL